MDPKDVKELDDFTTNELMLKLDKKNNPGRMHKALRYLRRLEQIKVIRNITEEHEIHIQKLQKIFPLFGLKTILCKLQKNEEVTDEELAVIVTFVDSFCTVSLHPAIVGSIVAEIAKKVNQHHHTQTCRKFKTVCRFNMPKLPSYETIIARPPMKEMSAKDRSSLEEKQAVILKKVRDVLDNRDFIKDILEKYPKENEKNKNEADQGRKLRINAVLEKAGLVSTEEKESYFKALKYSSSGYAVVMARDIDELMVNPYNPEITLAWDGNTDFQFCFDFYAIITYITEYFTKDDNGAAKFMIETLKASSCTDLKEKMKLLMNTWIKHRQMGEAEAVFRLTREFHFRDSDTKCVFVQTCPRSERSKILKNVTDKREFSHLPKVKVSNHKEGEYIEQYDMNSKYERRDRLGNPELDGVSFAQISRMFSPFWGKERTDADDDIYNHEPEAQDDILDDTICSLSDVQSEDEEIRSLSTEYQINPSEFNIADAHCRVDKFKFVMRFPLKEGQGEPLPKIFKILDPFPGEPPFMKLRTKPAVLRYHKYNASRDPDSYWYSEAVLYLPHTDEEDLKAQIMHAKQGGRETWDIFVAKISHVKQQVMEYLEENEEARLMAEDMINNKITGELLDPQGEQINEDDKLDTIEQHEEFQHLDPEFCEGPNEHIFEEQFRPIEVRPLEDLRLEARRMDFYQRKVLEIGIHHARCIVKARGGKNPIPENPPLIMVDGAAGSGKSCTINILKQFLKLILQKPGDNPDCPYVVLCAPTGTAAVNIKGQTLHTAFAFTWGNEHLSLSDKTRDTKRATFKNLKFLIIDEISMVKADQLYQIDLRLRELMMQPNKLFGGIALFVFGDVMQLKPVKGVYIWCQPINKEYHQAYQVQPHWERFAVISLIENHRQQGDSQYADILNRIRVGESTEDDMAFLNQRVRAEGHTDIKGATVIACKHVAVNKYNRLGMEQINSELFEIDAINSHSNIPDFVPKIDVKKGTVGTTAYVQKLQIKAGCRVMMIDNIDISDSLCNGSLGTVRTILQDKHGMVAILMVLFDNPDSGRELRRLSPRLATAFPNCTPIKRQTVKYSTAKHSKGIRANLASVQQFPLIVSFASTTHKIQGATIEQPRRVAVDLRTVFGANQAYVMLGRVQNQNQLSIIDKLPEQKIYPDKEALEQLSLMKRKSVNQNPPIWERSTENIKVYFHNIQSLRDKIEDVIADTTIFYADIIVFAETWLTQETCESDDGLKVENYKLHLNSVGKGKGLAVYYNERTSSVISQSTEPLHQISKLDTKDCTVLCVYRSYGDESLTVKLKEMIPVSGSCLIIGDFNLCIGRQENHEVFQTLRSLHFQLLSIGPTHIKGGHIDQVWKRCIDTCDLAVYSPYYTCKDHDALLFTYSGIEVKTGDSWIFFL